jgi:hypothetical protein
MGESNAGRTVMSLTVLGNLIREGDEAKRLQIESKWEEKPMPKRSPRSHTAKESWLLLGAPRIAKRQRLTNTSVKERQNRIARPVRVVTQCSRELEDESPKTIKSE